MPEAPQPIKRYPNRRYYAKRLSKYVSLEEIEQLVAGGENVEIRDSRSGEDLTRAVLTQIILERQPEKLRLFPVDMLHFILRTNRVMADFLSDYFRNSLTYLEYLQRHGSMRNLAKPMHWLKAWLDGAAAETPAAQNDESPPPKAVADEQAKLAHRIEQLESRIRELEQQE